MINAELRQQWLNAGAPWFSHVRKPSEAWQQELDTLRKGLKQGAFGLSGWQRYTNKYLDEE